MLGERRHDFDEDALVDREKHKFQRTYRVQIQAHVYENQKMRPPTAVVDRSLRQSDPAVESSKELRSAFDRS